MKRVLLSVAVIVFGSHLLLADDFINDPNLEREVRETINTQCEHQVKAFTKHLAFIAKKENPDSIKDYHIDACMDLFVGRGDNTLDDEGFDFYNRNDSFLEFLTSSRWNKNSDKEKSDTVICRTMSPLKTVILLIICAVGIWLYKAVLSALGGNQALLDSASTTISVIANALMVMRYREQWILWIIVDAVTVGMWFIAGDYIMTAMWAFYLINAVYGYITWTRLSKNQCVLKEDAAA